MGCTVSSHVVLDLTVTDLHQVCTENCNSQIRHHVVAYLPTYMRTVIQRFVKQFEWGSYLGKHI